MNHMKTPEAAPLSVEANDYIDELVRERLWKIIERADLPLSVEDGMTIVDSDGCEVELVRVAYLANRAPDLLRRIEKLEVELTAEREKSAALLVTAKIVCRRLACIRNTSPRPNQRHGSDLLATDNLLAQAISKHEGGAK